jgi:osmotically-inducible protein OsmY
MDAREYLENKTYFEGATMPTRLSLAAFTLLSGLLILSGAVLAQENSVIYMAENSPLENTQQNIRDKDNTTLTSQNQKQDKSDIKITAHIRKAVHRDKSLSVDAHNAKIITQDRVVTLRGPVNTEAESLKLQEISEKTQDVVQVDNQLEIKAP